MTALCLRALVAKRKGFYMENELGKCCRCGEEIGPPFDRETDWLCKHCYDKTRPKGSFRYNPRMNDEPIRTAEEREQEQKWQDRIIDKVDRENAKH